MTDGAPESVLQAVRRDGARAVLDAGPRGDEGLASVSTERSVQCLEAACERGLSDEEMLAQWAAAGAFGSFEALDALLADILPGGLFKSFSGRRRRLRDGARQVLVQSSSVPAVKLGIAVLGAAGDRTDVPLLEELAVHPMLCHYGVTALANLGMSNRAGTGALLRLLHKTASAERVIVIDRLLWFVKEPAVRFALVRDGLRGMEPADAREVADAIYDSCRVEQGLDDEASPPEVREGCALILKYRRSADDAAEL
jgi:hypothetical protein